MPFVVGNEQILNVIAGILITIGLKVIQNILHGL
jgi:hypothetical protein